MLLNKSNNVILAVSTIIILLRLAIVIGGLAGLLMTQSGHQTPTIKRGSPAQSGQLLCQPAHSARLTMQRSLTHTLLTLIVRSTELDYNAG